MCEQSLEIADAYRDFQSAWVNLAQVQLRWNDEVSAYLREEKYMGTDADAFIQQLVETTECFVGPLQRLAQDHQNLCNDLLRVGRGESFSV